jgi:hypothetical protein
METGEERRERKGIYEAPNGEGIAAGKGEALLLNETLSMKFVETFERERRKQSRSCRLISASYWVSDEKFSTLECDGIVFSVKE